MERQSADLSPASGPCPAYDPRRCAQGRRSAAVGAQRRGRISGQSSHGSQGLPTLSSRGACRDEARSRHVRNSRRAGFATEGRTPEISYPRMAEDCRDYSAARHHTERTAACNKAPVVENWKGEALTLWL